MGSIDDLLNYIGDHPENIPTHTTNLYKRLELPDFSSVTKVKKNYRWPVAKKWDPHDKPDDHKEFFAAQFKAVVDAYNILSDKGRKVFYDSWLKNHGSSKTFAPDSTFAQDSVRPYEALAGKFIKSAKSGFDAGNLMLAAMGITFCMSIPDINEEYGIIVSGALLLFEAPFAIAGYYFGVRQSNEANRLYRAASYYNNKQYCVTSNKYQKFLLRVGDTIKNIRKSTVATF